MQDEIVYLLKRHAYFLGLDDDVIADVSDHCTLGYAEQGDCVQAANRPTTRIAFVVRGRLEATYINPKGEKQFFRQFARGDQFGSVGAVMAEPIPISVEAIEPCTIIFIDYEKSLELTYKHKSLRRQWSRAFGNTLRQIFLQDKPAQKPTAITIFHESDETRPFTAQLVNRLVSLGETPGMLSDLEQPPDISGLQFATLRPNGEWLDIPEVRKQVSSWTNSKRIIFEVGARVDQEIAERLVGESDFVLVCLRPNRAKHIPQLLKSIESRAPKWRDRISIVWCLNEGSVAPYVPQLTKLAARDFKVYQQEIVSPLGRSCKVGFDRLLHFLRDVRIGVALGGGAARGMAHLGVLKALEQSGIVVDMIAGTSAGAMTGVVYSSGLDPDYSADRFANDLRPSKLFRMMPRGGYWYLLNRYRRGKFDPMLRKYLKDYRLEQLPIPCCAITVDLVSGSAVTRETGDAVHAILESINLPVLSNPICRDGQALVDGGLVNNLPANVLVAKGCRFVIAVSVTAKMEREFGGNRPDTPTKSMRSPSTLQTLMRSYVVQNHNVNSICAQAADLTIEPDVTGIDLDEFTRTVELAQIGHDATLEHVERIQNILHSLDDQLFPSPSPDSSAS